MEALDALRNASGYDATASVFESRAAYLTASDGSDATDSLAVTVADGVDAPELHPRGSATRTVPQGRIGHPVLERRSAGAEPAISLSERWTATARPCRSPRTCRSRTLPMPSTSAKGHHPASGRRSCRLPTTNSCWSWRRPNTGQTIALLRRRRRSARRWASSTPRAISSPSFRPPRTRSSKSTASRSNRPPIPSRTP